MQNTTVFLFASGPKYSKGGFLPDQWQELNERKFAESCPSRVRQESAKQKAVKGDPRETQKLPSL